MDEALYFDLPGEAERAQILAVYLDSYILKAGSAQGAPAQGPCSGDPASAGLDA